MPKTIRKQEKIYKVGFKYEPKTDIFPGYTERQAKFRFWMKNIQPIQHHRAFESIVNQLVAKKVGII